MGLNRRSFFGAAAAAVAAPIAAEPPSSSPIAMMLGFDAQPMQSVLGEMRTLVAAPGRWAEGGGDYVYRTGFPQIDALRSVSGVHRALMEKRLGNRL